MRWHSNEGAERGGAGSTRTDFLEQWTSCDNGEYRTESKRDEYSDTGEIDRPMVETSALDRALGACEKLLALSQALPSVIDADDIEHLDEIIAERERLLASLDLGALGLAFDASGAAGTAGRSTSKLSLLVERLQALLRIDEENQDALRSRLAGIRKQLVETGRARQCVHKYAYLTPKAEPAYLDKRQ